MFDRVIINAFISSMLLLAAKEASASGSEKSRKLRKNERFEKSGKVPKPACPPTMYYNLTDYNMVRVRGIATPIIGTVGCSDNNFCVGDDLIVVHNVYSEPTLETKIVGKFHTTVKVVDIEADGTDIIVMVNTAIKLYDDDSALVSNDTEIYWAGIYTNKEGYDPLYTYDVPLLGGTGK